MSGKTLRAIGLTLFALSLASCGGGGIVKRINPPVASVQQLRAAPDGNWSLVLRINNFSTVPMRFERVEAVLSVDGSADVPVAASLAFDVPGQSAEVVSVTVRGNRTLDATRGFAYRLVGTITTSAPDDDRFEFEKQSRLEPVPGIPGEFR
jgi:hypothetical protein